jgi:DNA polymerase III delta prime subunit
MVADVLAGIRFSVEEYNGKLVTVETVKQWMGNLGATSLFGVYSVKIINEMDRCTRDAQDLLLSYLDRLPPGRAVIGTSNLQLDLLTERFQTRFQSIKLAAPSTEDIADLLRRHWPVDQGTALRIAVGSGGCVRAALADLESWLDAEGLS